MSTACSASRRGSPKSAQRSRISPRSAKRPQPDGTRGSTGHEKQDWYRYYKIRNTTSAATDQPAEYLTMAFALSSPAFADNGAIPKQYTCEGADISPPLNWSGAPQSTRSFALIVDDPDAPDPRAPKLTWVHWVVHNIPGEARGLPEGARGRGLPAGAVQGRNDWKRAGYGGPCPRVGRHRYVHKLYAGDGPSAFSSALLTRHASAKPIGCSR